MNRRTARTIREGITVARHDHRFLTAFIPYHMQSRVFRELLKSGGPSSTIGGNAYAVALTRLTRKATP